jgi:hypothetical protein
MASLASEPRSRSDRLYDLLDKSDYRVIAGDEDREAVFRLRYEAYLQEEAIRPNFARQLSDHYDDLDNTTIFGLFVDGNLASTIRVHVATADYPEFPAMPSFPDALGPALAAGKVIVEASRHATGRVYSQAFPQLMPFMTIRITWLAAEYFGADLYIAAVRKEHQAFYKRVFDGEVVCDPRPYNQLIKPLSLMTCDYRAQRDSVHHRYPIFRSSQFERKMLFGRQAAASLRIGELQPDGATLGAAQPVAEHRAGLARVGERSP